MKKIQFGVLTLLSCLILLAVGCQTKPIENIIDRPIPTSSGKALTMEQISQGIKKAGAKLGWIMTQDASNVGNITAFLTLRGHSVTSIVTFNQAHYSIMYKESINMERSGNMINHKYNTWVENLAKVIGESLMQIANPSIEPPVLIKNVGDAPAK